VRVLSQRLMRLRRRVPLSAQVNLRHIKGCCFISLFSSPLTHLISYISFSKDNFWSDFGHHDSPQEARLHIDQIL
jgi:hypothetical protein